MPMGHKVGKLKQHYELTINVRAIKNNAEDIAEKKTEINLNLPRQRTPLFTW